MTTWSPDPAAPPAATYWQLPGAAPASDPLLAGLRARLVALVAAMVSQGTIALLGVLPALPGAGGAPANFWAQFAVLEFIAAIVVSLAFGPGVRVRDVPIVGRVFLGLGFVVVPAAAIALGAIDAAQAADGSTAAATWLRTAFFTTLFFGLPLLALVDRRAR
jgi:hypothetical protein